MLETAAAKFMWSTAADIAAAVAPAARAPSSVVEATLARIRERDPLLNSFTAVTEQRALARAQAIDDARARGKPLGPLAGVPFAVKNLFDVAGLPTLAGSKINRDAPPAVRDAALIERLEAAGAILVGALNMGEYAYDFTGENIHDGAVAQSARSRAHDRRLFGRLRRRGRRRPRAVRARLRHQRLDPRARFAVRHVRAEADLRTAVAARAPFRSSRASTMSVRWRAPRAISRSPTTPCRATIPTIRFAPTARPNRSLPLLEQGADGLRVAVAGGYFKCRNAETVSAVDRVAAALGANRDIEIPQAERARSAAFVITASEGASLHLDRLRTRAARLTIRRCATG